MVRSHRHLAGACSETGKPRGLAAVPSSSPHRGTAIPISAQMIPDLGSECETFSRPIDSDHGANYTSTMVVHTPAGRTDQTDAAPSASTLDTEALIEEARRRRRLRRRRNTAVVLVPLVVVALVVALVSLTSGGGHSRPPAGAAHRPGGSPAAAGTQTAPPGTGLMGRGPTAVDFVDADHGWIASGSLTTLVGNPTIVRTTDGGATWQQIPVPKTAGVSISTAARYYFGGLVGIHFATPMLGWYCPGRDPLAHRRRRHDVDPGPVPVGGAVVSVTSTGSEVWALVRDGTCTPPAADCTPQAVSLFVAPLPGRTWRQVGGLIDVGRYSEGSLLPASSHGVLVLAATGTYAVSSAAGRRDRAVTGARTGTPLAPSCQAVGGARRQETGRGV